MLISKISTIDGSENVMDLDVTEEQLQELMSPGRRMIQDIFPDLSAEEREFLLTGVTPDQWRATFGDDTED